MKFPVPNHAGRPRDIPELFQKLQARVRSWKCRPTKQAPSMPLKHAQRACQQPLRAKPVSQNILKICKRRSRHPIIGRIPVFEKSLEDKRVQDALEDLHVQKERDIEIERSLRRLRIDGCSHQCIDERMEFLPDAFSPDWYLRDVTMTDVEIVELQTDVEMEDIQPILTMTSTAQSPASALPVSAATTLSAPANSAFTPTSAVLPTTSFVPTPSSGISSTQYPIPLQPVTDQSQSIRLTKSTPARHSKKKLPKPANAQEATPFAMNGQSSNQPLVSPTSSPAKPKPKTTQRAQDPIPQRFSTMNTLGFQYLHSKPAKQMANSVRAPATANASAQSTTTI